MTKFRLVENSFDEVKNDDFFDKIALVAHNCYQVKEKDHQSNIGFIQRLIQSQHLAMIEHYSFTFEIPENDYKEFLSLNNSFFHVVSFVDPFGISKFLLSTSLRPVLENLNTEDIHLKKLISNIIASTPEEVIALFPKVDNATIYPCFDLEANKADLPSLVYDKMKYVTYHLVTDRGVTHEIVRHRLCSFAQESTRYCNYTKDKFDNCLTFMKPLGYEEWKDTYDSFYQKCCDTYFDLISKGATPDQARSVLPNSIKASIMVTCNIEEWKKIFELRTDSHAHEDIRRLMGLVKADMTEKGYL